MRARAHTHTHTRNHVTCKSRVCALGGLNSSYKSPIKLVQVSLKIRIPTNVGVSFESTDMHKHTARKPRACSVRASAEKTTAPSNDTSSRVVATKSTAMTHAAVREAGNLMLVRGGARVAGLVIVDI